MLALDNSKDGTDGEGGGGKVYQASVSPTVMKRDDGVWEMFLRRGWRKLSQSMETAE